MAAKVLIILTLIGQLAQARSSWAGHPLNLTRALDCFCKTDNVQHRLFEHCFARFWGTALVPIIYEPFVQTHEDLLYFCYLDKTPEGRKSRTCDKRFENEKKTEKMFKEIGQCLNRFTTTDEYARNEFNLCKWKAHEKVATTTTKIVGNFEYIDEGEQPTISNESECS